MSDEGEKTCPLCAEEMDLTDQQLKPCRCGYEICVWCWHHIMEMAEKDETEGRCPACRTPYDKEKIVGTENCGRVVADMNIDKKQKSQKARVKTSESRKQLSTVRVIQRNLVYIVGLPLDFADEDLLQCRDYFGQYGKVLKVSISRTSAGTIQQFANDTCSVYITYSTEEEAVRCIQSVHGFILDGRPLRACFGTTKYCHAWLRNVPCTNVDCLYLHEVGSQEDSFTKDEIISAYTRSRVQQITGVTYNTQRRSGDMLPPPADDHNVNNSAVTTGKPVAKISSNNTIRSSPPTCSYTRSGALPAAASWGARASTCNQPATSMASANGPTKQKAEISPPSELSTAVSGTQSSTLMLNEVTNGKQSLHKLEVRDTPKQKVGVNSQTNVIKVSTPLDTPLLKSTSQQSCPPATDSNVGEHSITLNNELSVERQSCLDLEKSGSSLTDGNIQNLCSESEISSLRTDNHLIEELSGTTRPTGLCLNNFLSPRSQGLQQHESEKLGEHSIPGASDSLSVASEVCDQLSNVKLPGMQNLTHESEDDFDSQRLRDAIVVSQTTIPTSFQLHLLSHLRGSSQQHSPATVNNTGNSPIVNRMHDEGLVANASPASNGFINNHVSQGSGQSNSFLVNGEQGNRMTDVYDVRSGNSVYQPSAPDMGESSIISNILNLDSWDDSLTSPLNLAKLLGETDRQEGPVKLENSWKGNSDQSRFSFARQEESRNHLFDFSSAHNITRQASQSDTFGQAFENREPFVGRHGSGFSFPQRNIEPPENFTSGCFGLPSSKPSSSVSRSQISAPPGFSARSRPPPPGFPSHERSDQTYDLQPGNHYREAASLRNNFQPSPNSNMSTYSDIEFIDPAILAVGKGRLPNDINNSGMDMRPNFHVQTPSFEHDSRLQLLLQRSLPPQENHRYRDVKDNFSPPSDAYGYTSRYMEQSQSSNLSPYSQFSFQQARNNVVSNGHWDGWGEMQSANSMGMSELLRSDGSGFNKYGMATSGDLYNNSFRM